MPEDILFFTNNPERIVSGFADLYTWRTRSISIQESMKITKLAFASGVKCVSTGQIDPMLAYRIDERVGKLPMQFNNRGLWRDFDSLLPDQSGLAPLILDHAITLARIDPKRFPSSIIVLGQANDKAKIEFWRMERFTIPQALLGDCSIRSGIKSLFGNSKRYAKGSMGEPQKPMHVMCLVEVIEIRQEKTYRLSSINCHVIHYIGQTLSLSSMTS